MSGGAPSPETAAPRRRPGVVALVAVVIVVAVAAAAFVGVSIAGFWAYANHDRVDYVDRPDVTDAAGTACAAATVALLDAIADEESHRARIADGNAAIDELVASMEALGDDTLADDRPAVSWLEDRRSLEAARSSYADEVTGRPAATFAVPQTQDGYPITGRMTDASPSECEQTIELAAHP